MVIVLGYCANQVLLLFILMRFRNDHAFSCGKPYSARSCCVLHLLPSNNLVPELAFMIDTRF